MLEISQYQDFKLYYKTTVTKIAGAKTKTDMKTNTKE
jgi:hypothetical protein